MKKIIHITSSTKGAASFSTQLGKAIIEKLQIQYPDSQVILRDLIADPAPYVSTGEVAAFFMPEDQHTEEMIKAAAYSKAAVTELLDADILVISAPLINLSIPAQLKSWLDHITRSGQTFRYSEAGPEGLVKGKKVFLALSGGAVYTEGPMQAFDFLTPYLKGMLGFLGMTDTTAYWADGTSVPGWKETTLERAIQSISIPEDLEAMA
ncbi:NAD(P)H-dependent oxidoreductase [Fluviicola sp.]|uniref:FMN-dependent NADH-azoreductase n=1 Tax=Fluviicola sp. TaxID=1917219 RepID=UPI0031D6829D